MGQLITKSPPSELSATNGSSHVLAEMSFEEFLNWDGENQHVEWVDGKVIEMSPVSTRHQFIVRFLLSTLSIYTSQRNLGQLLQDPFVMKTGTMLPGRAPDLIFIANKNLSRLHDKFLDGPADLVIEVVSPDDPKRDYVHKFSEYERGGVREYWIIDPLKREAHFYQLQDGKFQDIAPNDDRYESISIEGLWIRPSWLHEEPLPDALSILREWQLI